MLRESYGCPLRKRLVIGVTGEGKDEVFDSVKELALEYGVHYNTASRALAQNRLFLRKYILSYVD